MSVVVVDPHLSTRGLHFGLDPPIQSIYLPSCLVAFYQNQNLFWDLLIRRFRSSYEPLFCSSE